MPDSNNWGYQNKPAGGGVGGTGANPTTEANQTRNSFLTGALISLEPEAPIGNWAGRRGKTSQCELAATHHRSFHQTWQPPWHKAEIAPKNKIIREVFVYVYMKIYIIVFACVSKVNLLYLPTNQFSSARKITAQQKVKNPSRLFHHICMESPGGWAAPLILSTPETASMHSQQHWQPRKGLPNRSFSGGTAPTKTNRAIFWTNTSGAAGCAEYVATAWPAYMSMFWFLLSSN